MHSLAIIEDNSTVLNYLAQIIGDAFPDAEISLFNNGEDASKILETKKVEMGLFDIELPGMSGIECLYRLKGFHPELKCMMLTNFDDAENILDAVQQAQQFLPNQTAQATSPSVNSGKDW